MIGILTGMGPEAGIHLQELILRNCGRVKTDQEVPEMLVYHATQVPDRTALIEIGEEEQLYQALSHAVKVLQKAGASVIGIPCNTCHFLVSRLAESFADMTFVHMIQETIDYINSIYSSHSKVGLMATNGTLLKGEYTIRAQKRGIEIIHPNEEEQKLLMNIIYSVKQQQMPTADIFRFVNDVIARWVGRGVQSIILGCTELPLVFTSDQVQIPLFSSTNILAQSLLKSMRK